MLEAGTGKGLAAGLAMGLVKELGWPIEVVLRVGKTKLLKVMLVGIGALITACFGIGNDRPPPEPA